MTDQEAHERLRQFLPGGSTITLSRMQWSRSTVGADDPISRSDGDWHLTVTIPDDVDHVEASFGPDLASVVNEVIGRARALEGRSKPPKLASPSSIFAEDSERRQVS